MSPRLSRPALVGSLTLYILCFLLDYHHSFAYFQPLEPFPCVAHAGPGGSGAAALLPAAGRQRRQLADLEAVQVG